MSRPKKYHIVLTEEEIVRLKKLAKSLDLLTEEAKVILGFPVSRSTIGCILKKQITATP